MISNIKKILLKIKHFALNNKIKTAVIVLVLVVLIVVIMGSKKTSSVETIVTGKRNLIEQVSITGNVKPLSNLDLAFEKSGKVSGVYAQVGDNVYQGQVLVRLDSADLYASLAQAEANLSAEQSNLDQIKRGTRPEELIISESAYKDAKQSLDDKMVDAYNKADDAIRNNIDQMFTDPRSSTPEIINFNDSQLQNTVNDLRYKIELLLVNWNAKGSNLPIDTAYSNLDQINAFLNKIATGVNALTANTSNLSQANVDKYKLALSTARSEVGQAISNLNLTESTYNAAKATYDLKVAGNTPETISAQEARVAQMAAQVENIKAQLSKNIIYSPINGVVVKQEAKIGEIVVPSSIIVSVISASLLDVEGYVPEADIARIELGDVATTTLDAYGSDTFFKTSVIKIDPAETVIEGVPTYKVTLKFASSSDTRIKSGMTANLDILTAQRMGALSVPSRSVYSVDGGRYVKLVNPKDKTKLIETEVKTGIRGIDGYVEVLSGLKEGDLILSSPNI